MSRLRATGDTATIERQATSGARPTTNGAPDVRTTLEAWLPYVVWGWAAGVAAPAGTICRRLLARASAASRIPRGAHIAVASGGRADCQKAAAGDPVRVVESALIDTPSVIGLMRPLILLPIAALSSLSPGQVEALLAHELAHIRRRDYAVNLLQTVAETLLFFHPAVWWVSSRIREAREHCCDDVAVEVCGEPAAYAAALAELATWRAGGVALSVGATDGPLLMRVRRLLGAPEDACAPVDRWAGRCGGCTHAGGRRRSAIERAEFGATCEPCHEPACRTEGTSGSGRLAHTQDGSFRPLLPTGP